MKFKHWDGRWPTHLLQPARAKLKCKLEERRDDGWILSFTSVNPHGVVLYEYQVVLPFSDELTMKNGYCPIDVEVLRVKDDKALIFFPSGVHSYRPSHLDGRISWVNDGLVWISTSTIGEIIQDDEEDGAPA